jgi:hypothetical protein
MKVHGSNHTKTPLELWKKFTLVVEFGQTIYLYPIYKTECTEKGFIIHFYYLTNAIKKYCKRGWLLRIQQAAGGAYLVCFTYVPTVPLLLDLPKVGWLTTTTAPRSRFHPEKTSSLLSLSRLNNEETFPEKQGQVSFSKILRCLTCHT